MSSLNGAVVGSTMNQNPRRGLFGRVRIILEIAHYFRMGAPAPGGVTAGSTTNGSLWESSLQRLGNRRVNSSMLTDPISTVVVPTSRDVDFHPVYRITS
jgi:hypothetical protein